MAAVLGGKPDSVRELLARGADPELPNREGMTPLQAAAFQNQRDVIEALIEGGAVVEVRCSTLSFRHQAGAVAALSNHQQDNIGTAMRTALINYRGR